jgi:AcrR family transcriptional regulator
MTETSRQRRQRETRSALLKSAFALFSERGYAETSLDQVAARAGFTKGAVYGLFASKEDLFLALVDEQNAEAVEGLDEALPETACPELLLHSLGQFLAAFLRDKRGWALVNAEFTVLAARRPALAARRQEEVRTAVERISGLLERVHSDALPHGEPVALARVVVAVMNGLVLHAAIDPDVDVAADFSLALERLVFAEQRQVTS